MFADAIESILKDQCTPAVVRAIEGGASAALLAAAVLALNDPAIATALDAWRAKQTAAVAETPRDDA